MSTEQETPSPSPVADLEVNRASLLVQSEHISNNDRLFILGIIERLHDEAKAAREQKQKEWPGIRVQSRRPVPGKRGRR